MRGCQHNGQIAMKGPYLEPIPVGIEGQLLLRFSFKSSTEILQLNFYWL